MHPPRGITDDLPQTAQAKIALGRWALLDATGASSKEHTAVLVQVIQHLHDDTRAVRTALRALATDLLAARARIKLLEAQAAEHLTPVPRSIQLDDIEAAEADAFEDPEALETKWREISAIFEAYIQDKKKERR